jgi:hypothetical protein
LGTLCIVSNGRKNKKKINGLYLKVYKNIDFGRVVVFLTDVV